MMAVNRRQGLVLLDDGSVCPITNMLDEFGDETKDWRAMRSFVWQYPDGTWGADCLANYDDVAQH